MASWDQNGMWPHWKDHKGFCVLTSVLFIAVIGWVATEAWKNMHEAKTIGFEDRPAPSIEVNATGDASVVPDIAIIDLGVTVIASTAASAQDSNTEKMNAIVAAMKGLGIDEKDLKTSSYSVYPRYNYDVSPAAISGYEATQSLTVKIRNKDLSDDVIAEAGDLGANMIGSLRFDVDDDTAGLAEARHEAIEKAKAQAQSIANAMGRELGPIVSYNESQGGSAPISYRDLDAMANEAMGSGPEIEVGSTDLTVSVWVTYALE